MCRGAAGCRRCQPAFPGRREQRGKVAVLARWEPPTWAADTCSPAKCPQPLRTPAREGVGGSAHSPSFPPPPGEVIAPGAWVQSSRVSWGHCGPSSPSQGDTATPISPLPWQCAPWWAQRGSGQPAGMTRCSSGCLSVLPCVPGSEKCEIRNTGFLSVCGQAFLSSHSQALLSL